jgi:hypothetical protein
MSSVMMPIEERWGKQKFRVEIRNNKPLQNPASKHLQQIMLSLLAIYKRQPNRSSKLLEQICSSSPPYTKKNTIKAEMHHLCHLIQLVYTKYINTSNKEVK